VSVCGCAVCLCMYSVLSMCVLCCLCVSVSLVCLCLCVCVSVCEVCVFLCVRCMCCVSMYVVYGVCLCVVFFYGHTCSIWRFPGQRSNRSCSCWPTPQLQQCWIGASSAAYTTAHGNAIINPLSKARGRTQVLMDASLVCYR